jgi:hypothetical protein
MQREKKISRTRTIGFRLTEAEYVALVAAAEQDQRRTAELVRLMVLDALKRRMVEVNQTTQKVEAGQ